jgi:type II secretion system protein G
MTLRESRAARGFTLIELLIVIAIIGIISAILIPNLLDAMQKAKQKRAMSDMKMVGTAMMAWLTDQAAGAAAAGASQTTIDISTITPKSAPELESILTPAYVQEIPRIDPWDRPYDYHLMEENPNAVHVLAVRSSGRDRVDAGDEYTTGSFEPTDYDQDIVWVDGGFIRWPQRTES